MSTDIESGKPSRPKVSPVTGETVRDALNRHGTFLKKRLLHELLEIPGWAFLGEEYGTTFGGTRVADIIAIDQQPRREVYYLIEAKRVLTGRAWLFLPHWRQQFRHSRTNIQGTFGGDIIRRNETDVTCSEGFEFPSNKSTAEQSPIFEAASQLAAAYLGLIRNKDCVHSKSELVRAFVPILVTTADLFIVRAPMENVSLDTGELAEIPDLEARDFVRLNHPFPTPEGVDYDFRDEDQNSPNEMIYTETIYVVRAAALSSFLNWDRRAGFAE